MLPEGDAAPVFGHESAGPVRLDDRLIGWMDGTTFTEVQLP